MIMLISQATSRLEALFRDEVVIEFWSIIVLLKNHQWFSDSQLNFLIVANTVVIVLATLWSGGQFIGIDNLQSMAGQLPELGLLAIGITLAMISGGGGIDLSGVALANLSSVIAALITPSLFDVDLSQASFAMAFICIALITGLLGGVFNGLLIAKAQLTPILATLGTQLVFTGIAVVWTNGSAVRIGYDEPLAMLGNETLFWIPIPFIIFLIVVLSLGLTLRRTPYGVRLYLMGTNREAARYAGIPTVRMLFITYGVCGMFAATAGVLIASRTASAKWDYGSSYLLIAILIAVMAGVKPSGGHGRISCLLLSATALQMLSSAFNLAGVSTFFGECIWGLLLLLFAASSSPRTK